ncbi:unnamed protein product [Allacma fusca]|uniref:Uncharacterized protein n=1 Tax=Allacma fusca TaxID=39272 RepID=A0A8J2NSF2_9HEXA|nr:unnamed protein product [Allacma fusca]
MVKPEDRGESGSGKGQRKVKVPLRKKSKSESVTAIDGSIMNADHYVDDLEMEKLILEEESDVEVIEDSAIVRNSRKRKANGKSKGEKEEWLGSDEANYLRKELDRLLDKEWEAEMKVHVITGSGVTEGKIWFTCKDAASVKNSSEMQ